MQRLFTLIVVPTDLGGVPGPRRGAKYLGEALKRMMGPQVQTVVNLEERLPFGIFSRDSEGGSETPRYRNKVSVIAGAVKDAVTQAYTNRTIPFVVGGDHSIAIGSLAASLEWWSGNCGVLWADQHPDLHTPETSQSKRAHGMPLRTVLGEGDELLTRHVSFKLDPEFLIHFGAGSIEKGEHEYIEVLRKRGAFFGNHVHRNNPLQLFLLEQRIRQMAVHAFPWVLEFDIDVLCLRGVPKSCYDPQGMRPELLRKILGWATQYLNIVAVDVVEYSPQHDEDNTCMQVVDIMQGVVGKVRYPKEVLENA